MFYSTAEKLKSDSKSHTTDKMASNGNGSGNMGSTEAIQTDIITLSRFITEEQAKHPEATGDFTYASQIYDQNVILTGIPDYFVKLCNSHSSR